MAEQEDSFWNEDVNPDRLEESYYLGQQEYFTEEEAYRDARNMTSGNTDDSFFDRAVDHVDVVHYSAGEEYSYWDEGTKEYVTEILTADIWVVEFYGDREWIYQ